MDRRKFISTTGKATLGICCLGAMSTLDSCTSVKYAKYTLADKSVKVNKSELEGNKYVIVDDEKLENGPIYLTNDNEKKEIIALSMICTHRSCQVDPAGNILVCPCHGAEFNNQGKVLAGPTSVDLPKYKLTIEKEIITIHLP